MVQGAQASGGWAERVERLARLVPGLGRYQDREGLRETDKKVRNHLADQFANVGGILEAAQAKQAESGQLDRLPALDRLSRSLATLTDRVRYASYGFAGVFDSGKIREAELSRLHGFDLSLMDQVPQLRERLTAVADPAAQEAAFDAARAALDDFGRRLTERERVARGL